MNNQYYRIQLQDPSVPNNCNKTKDYFSLMGKQQPTVSCLVVCEVCV